VLRDTAAIAVNAPRGRHARRQKRQRPIMHCEHTAPGSLWSLVVADLVSGSLVKELVGCVAVAPAISTVCQNGPAARPGV